VLIILLTITSTVELAVGRGAPDAPRTALWFDVLAVVIMAVSLLARRQFPFAAPAVYWLLAGAFSFADGSLIPFVKSIYVLGMAAAFLMGNLRDARKSGLGLVIVLGGAVSIAANIPTHTVGELVFIPLPFGISWFAGFVLRERAAQAEAAEGRAARAELERDGAARLAVAEERARIARELHDIVAHSVSVMVLQVGAVRHGLPDALARQRDALQGVEEVGRTALNEMRRLLAATRPDGDGAELTPSPGLDDLDPLVDATARAGLPVLLQIEGQRVALPRALDLSAYRIVQEGLTNALKHAHATRADLTLSYRTSELQIEVRDDGCGPAPGDGLGHGLVGIRERVKIYGGEMAAGPAAGGGFALTARLPLGQGQ